MILTIGIPVYNAEKFISRCLDSVMNLEDIDKYEVICVDDGSTDSTLDTLNKYAKAFRQLRVISTENEGAYRARERIIREAKGEWIGFIDADDTVEKDMYIKMLVKASSADHIDMVVSAFNKVDKVSEQIKAIQMNRFGNSDYDFVTNPLERGILSAVNPAYWNKIFRKSKIENRLQLRTSPKIMEDFLFFLSIIPNLNGVGFIDAPLYNYYDIETSLTKKIGTKELKDAEEGLRALLEYLQTNSSISNGKYIWDLVLMMVYIHLGIAFTINWNESNRITSIVRVYKETRYFIDKRLYYNKNCVFLSYNYVRQYPQIKKAFYACELYKSCLWPVVVKCYKFLSIVIKNDMKW